MKYLFHLGLLLKEGNPLMRDAIAECNKMIVRKQTCWLTSILHLLNMRKIDVKDQTLTTLNQHVVISTLKETHESRFVNEFFTVMSQSIPTGYIPRVLKKIARGSGFDSESCPGAENSTMAGFVEIQSETSCPCIGFIGDKYTVSQELLKNGEHYIVDFQFKLRLNAI